MGLLARPATPGSTASSHKSASAVILDGTIISLSLLEKMVDGVQIPFLKGSVGAALEMIKIAKAVHMNKLDCEDLILRTTSLLVVILGSLNGKEEKDIPEGLRRNIERLSGSFHQVLGELRTIERRAQKSITGFVYYLDNAEKLKSCVMKLDWAMQEFQVTSKVDTCLSELQRYEQLKKGQTEILEAVGKSQAEILEAVGKTQKELSIISISLPSSVMPEDPIIFGREAYVERAVILILSNDQVRLAILGPGGMGKTSVALKIVHDARVVARFGRRCYWVPCEQATSLNMFIELIAKSLDLPATTSNDRFKDIIASLESTIVLRFFLLDNFETTWDIEGQQSEIAQHLSRLASVPGVSFIVTMRGTHYPTLNSTQWTQPRLPALEPLALDPARQAFLRIAPSATEDSELDSLIKEVDRMPLAITLMAKLADAGESPTDLLEQWKIELTGLLDQAGGDRSNSIEVSIRLSLQGNSVKHCPEATDFLRILARLPAGMPLDKISDFCPSISNWRKAIRILRGAALIYDSADNRRTVAGPPVIILQIRPEGHIVSRRPGFSPK
ncbi:hypothetical protein FRC02_001324 [Tulasnella sp. 418]|nr:hypothetical protein FRC02_001324 [Tulasnella sp. 418]